MKDHARCGCWSVLVGLAVLPLGLTSYALDPSKEISQYHLDIWTEQDGLPQGSVQAITQTRDGYLWIGTRGGLARFDGVSFTVFTSETTPGLKANDIRGLYEDRSGQLWIGTFNGGLSRYKEGTFTCYTTGDGLPSNGVLDFCEDRQGNLWMGTWNGIARYQQGRFTAITGAQGLVGRSSRSLCADQEGNVWIGTDRGLNRMKDGQFTVYTTKNGLRNNAVRKVYVDRDGLLWLGSLDGGLGRLSDGNFSYLNARDGLADDKVRAILQDHHGNLWIGTWDGLSRYQQGKLSSLTRQDRLPHDAVQCLFEDREGSLWIGTHGGGLARLRDGKFTMFTTKEGLANHAAKCVLETRAGTLWIGTYGGGLNRYQAGKFVRYSIKDGLPSNFVLSMAEDQNGVLWLGMGHPAALVRFQDGTITAFTPDKGLPIRNAVRVILADREQNLWLGGDDGGLCRFRGGQFTAYTTQDGLTGNLIRAIGQDRNGYLWVGTGSGLCRFDGRKFTGYTIRDGLSHNAVYSIYEDAAGTLWFGTQGGLTRYQDGRFSAYQTRQGLFHNMIYQVLEDDFKNLWMSCNRGVFSLSKNAVADFDRGQISSLPCVSYGVADGMATSQCEGGTQPSGWKSQDGKLWFCTVHGLAMINPNQIRRNRTPPPVLVEQVIAGGSSYDPRRFVRFGPNTEPLQFHYTALSFAAPEKVRFKYKLEGLDEHWVEADTRRVALYNRIPPGAYRFRVMACNNDGVWNERGAFFAFSLAPHFYQTPWFFGFCIAAAAVAAWSFHRYRMKQAQAEFALVLAERSRIARDLHDTLAQGFAGIAFQLEAVATNLTAAPGPAQQHLQQALHMVRHSLGEARRSVLNLRSGIWGNCDLARALSETSRQLLADQPMAIEMQTHGKARLLPSTIEDNLLRIGQEAITNTVKHAQAASMRIELEYEPRRVILRVRDDGKGFAVPSLSHANGAHFGLLGMEERAKHIGAQLQVHSQPGRGTEVRVEVPVV